MSKRIRNKQPSKEKIEKAVQAYKICKVIAGDDEALIQNVIKMHPDTFIKAAKSIGIERLDWMGLIDWIEENKDEMGDDAPSFLKPTKINYIKLVRTITDRGLREAKEAVDAYCYEKGYLGTREHTEVQDTAMRETTGIDRFLEDFEDIPF